MILCVQCFCFVKKHIEEKAHRILVEGVYDMKMSDKTYDVLKYIAQYVLPAAGTLYFALAGIWGLPYSEQVVGTVTAIDTFIGVMLGLTKSSYEKESEKSE